MRNNIYNINFSEALKLKIIKEFISSNNRVPTLFELNEEIAKTYRDVPKLDSSGYLPHTKKFVFDEISSSSITNGQFSDLYFNLDFIRKQLELLYSKLTDRVYRNNAVYTTLYNQISKLDRQAAAQLLASGYQSNLIYTITEDFNSDTKILLAESSVLVSSEGVSRSLSSYEDLSSLISKLKYSITATKGYSNISTSDSIDTLSAMDGNYWVAEVRSIHPYQKVSCVISLSLKESTDISLVKVGVPNSSKLIASVFRAVSGEDFEIVGTKRISSSLTPFRIHCDDVASLKVILTKEEYDTIDPDTGEYIFYFKIDTIEIVKAELENGQSTLIAGPYSFEDLQGNNIVFSHVSLSACYENVENSWIEFYLSSDKETWIPVNPAEDNQAGSIVSFEKNLKSVDLLSTVNSDLDDSILDYENSAALELDQYTSYLNSAGDIDKLDSLSHKNVFIYRNIVTDDNKSLTVFDVPVGWYLDLEHSLYTTTLQVDIPDGITLDFGTTTAYIDNVLVTGTITIESGLHNFATNQSNWIAVASDLDSESDLKQNDPLYPYNHKLLIEGYDYPTSFKGNRVYNGVSSYYSKKLSYVSKSVFDASKTDLSIYTTVSDDNLVYFLVHTYKGYDDYTNESYSIDISIPDRDNNEIYLKAVFRSSDELSTSVLKSFTLRVA